uniref:Uncharacterized protein n=1 Tax=Anguilla anguilla TaxID=7936 RepID=A0A0E9T3P7_ANGAN
MPNRSVVDLNPVDRLRIA